MAIRHLKRGSVSPSQQNERGSDAPLVGQRRHVTINGRVWLLHAPFPQQQKLVSHEAFEYEEIKKYLESLPSAEPWLDGNQEAKASVERGLQQAANGEVHYLGSFAQFADLEIDD